MPFTLEHTLVSGFFPPEQHDTDLGTFFTVSVQGTFYVLHPGRLQKAIEASLRHKTRIDTPDTTVPPPPPPIDGVPTHPTPHPPPTGPDPLHNGVVVTTEGIPYDFHIYDPDGHEFSRDEITVADLHKFRDLRGKARPWTYSMRGQSRTYQLVEALNEAVYDAKAVINLTLLETIQSSSGAPLVPRTNVHGELSLKFDLNRVGRFVANLVHLPFNAWHGSMTLVDPDGTTFATTTTSRLTCPIPLAALGKSRDSSGNPRQWTLVVRPHGAVHPQQFVSATVIGEGRIGTLALQDRIQWLLGPDGSNFDLVGRNTGGRAQAVLTINDVATAETIDMHGLFDSLLKKNGRSTDVNAGEELVLFDDSEYWDYGLQLDAGSAKLKSLNVEVGPGRLLPAGTPVLRFRIAMDGGVKVIWQGQRLATIKLSGGRLELEVGMQIDPDGTPRIVHAANDDPFDCDFNNVVVALVVGALPIAGLGILGLKHYVKESIEDRLSSGLDSMFGEPSLAPRILMTLFGTHLTYLPVRFQGDDILFEHIAPDEPDPKPRRNYAGAIGRMVLEEAVGHVTFHPLSLGDTWKADNLKDKIDHIVVVMMENRSYDHVLGYRAMLPQPDGADGITPGLIAAVKSTAGAYDMRPLRNASFALNAAKRRTRIPKGVGHELADVTQQLSGQIDGPGGRKINSPDGFVNNFRERKLNNQPGGVDDPATGLVVPIDVLGYYEKSETEHYKENPTILVDDLPVYSFLSENYAYCDRYFCSHPGPTLPNRMFSLTGDVQYDRYGFPILDNNEGDNFLLSRAPTIYDLLTRNGVSWRVYESFPSVTMLRMYARYATDDVNIRPFDELAGDVAAGNLPSVTVIEPAMHHHPEDDDHPDADMYRGQNFIRRVYEALRGNPDTWRKTMLIITYDEHGGLYDHVIPPIADVFNAPEPSVVSDGGPVVVGMGDGSGGDHSGGGGGGVLGHGHLHITPEVLTVLLGEVATADTQPSNAPVKVPYGVRVPTFVVSPWVAPGKGPGITLDHCSILKTILARFCGETKPFLSDRVHASQSFESYLTEAQPRDVGSPPELEDLPGEARRLVSAASRITTAPLTRKRMREEHVDYHELSGRLARMLGR